MARFLAPADVGGVTLTCGQFAVEEGIIEVPDDLGAGDRAGLAANGFQPEPPAKKGAKPKSEE